MSVRSALLAFAAVGAVAALVAVGAPTASAGSATEATEVVSVDYRPDGTKHVRLYSPAKGISAQTLATKLRKAGVRNAQVAPLAGPCEWGSARALECPPVGWAYNGYADPQVYFMDHTSSAWPMTAVVPDWNRAVGIDSYYRWHANGCPGNGVHCVHVHNANYGDTGWMGLAEYSTDGGDLLLDVTLKLNDYYATNSTLRRTTACHEAGHALGLGHGTSLAGCMSAEGTALRPHADDLNLLPRIYP